jgi:hypothetical protein
MTVVAVAVPVYAIVNPAVSVAVSVTPDLVPVIV